jgi:hypothetical protein
MSKFLLNLLVQISKALVYSNKSNFIRKRIFPVTFGPPGLSAQSFFYRPIFPPLPHRATASRPAQPPARPPGPAQSDRTCPFSELVRFCYLSVFSTSKLVRFGLKTCLIRSLRPQAAARTLGPLGPLGPSRVGVFAERRILFDFAHSGRDTFSLTSLPCGARLSAPFPSSPAGRPLPLVASGHPAPPGLQPRDVRQGLHSTP